VILSIDVGTTSLKLGVYDQELRQLAFSESGYRLDTPDPCTVQIDPEKWWQAFLEALQLLRFPLRKVEIISLSVNSPGFSIMDPDGRSLFPSFLHLDRRAYRQAKRILKRIGEKGLLEVTGNIPNPGASSAANILWLRDNYPAIEKKAFIFGHTNTFFAKRLTGKFGVDPSNICMSNLFNTVKGEGYDSTIAKELSIDLAQLPPVYQSCEKIGNLNSQSASLTSLKQGIPVLMGANDATCAALSADIVHHGDIMNVTGTTEMVVVCMDRPLASSGYNLKNHAVPNRWNSMFALNTGGKAIEWAYDQFFREMDKNDFYERLLPKLMIEERKNLPRFVPYLTGDRYSLRSKSASFSRITLNTTREDLLLAVIHGVVSKVRDFLISMEQKTDLHGMINVTGGAAVLLLQPKKRLMPGYSFQRVESGSLHGAAKLAQTYLSA
jgi:sugar (pentulose or hexulose) kinase